MTEEVWRPINGAPSHEVSCLGRVRRAKECHCSDRGRVLKHTVRKGSGYCVMHLRISPGVSRNVYVHRLVAMAFLGRPPTPKHEVAHENGNPQDNRLSNLRWSTRKDNHADKHRHGTARNQKGEANVNAKLTDVMVREIRAEWAATGETYSAIAAKHGVDHGAVRRICLRMAWKHVQ